MDKNQLNLIIRLSNKKINLFFINRKLILTWNFGLSGFDDLILEIKVFVTSYSAWSPWKIFF
jgi:hypothetical protein